MADDQNGRNDQSDQNDRQHDAARPSAIAESATRHLREIAERFERLDGRDSAMAILFRNAAYCAAGGDLDEYEWARHHARADGSTDDVAVKP